MGTVRRLGLALAVWAMPRTYPHHDKEGLCAVPGMLPPLHPFLRLPIVRTRPSPDTEQRWWQEALEANSERSGEIHLLHK